MILSHKHFDPSCPPWKTELLPSLVTWQHEVAALRTTSHSHSPLCSHTGFKYKATLMAKKKSLENKDTGSEV